MTKNKNLKRIFISAFIVFLVLFLLIRFFSKSGSFSHTIPGQHISNEHILFGYPSADCQVLVRKGYVLCYDEKTKVADWASYHMTDEYLTSHRKRSDDFRADPDVPAGKRSELRDYKGSGYDRGHLVPAADMSRNGQTMSESFLLTNMAPQTAGLNRGVWKLLEEDVRHWTYEKRNVYIMVGPLYLDSKGNRESAPATIGPDQIAVPTHFFKIIIAGNLLTPSQLEVIAFIMPNTKNPRKDVSEFMTSIDEIERLSGLDFMNELDKAVQDQLESKKEGKLWQ